MTLGQIGQLGANRQVRGLIIIWTLGQMYLWMWVHKSCGLGGHPPRLIARSSGTKTTSWTTSSSSSPSCASSSSSGATCTALSTGGSSTSGGDGERSAMILTILFRRGQRERERKEEERERYRSWSEDTCPPPDWISLCGHSSSLSPGSGLEAAPAYIRLSPGTTSSLARSSSRPDKSKQNEPCTGMERG